MGHTNTWSNSDPDGATTDAGQIDEEINQVRLDTQERLVLEHLFPLDDTDGVHRASGCAVLAADTTANLYTTALDKYELGGVNGAGNVTGSIAFDTTLNCMVYYNGSAAIPITPRNVAKTQTVTAITTSTSWQDIYDLGTITMVAGEILIVKADISVSITLRSAHRVMLQMRCYRDGTTSLGSVYEEFPVSLLGTINGTWYFLATSTSYTFKIQISVYSGAANYVLKTATNGHVSAIVYPGDYS